MITSFSDEDSLFFFEENKNEEDDENYFSFFPTKMSTDDLTDYEDEMRLSPKSCEMSGQNENKSKKEDKENMIGNKIKRESE